MAGIRAPRRRVHPTPDRRRLAVSHLRLSQVLATRDESPLAPRMARRLTDQARWGNISAGFDRATPSGGMQRRSNAVGLSPLAAGKAVPHTDECRQAQPGVVWTVWDAASPAVAPSVGAQKQDHLATKVRLEGTEVDLSLTFVTEQLEHSGPALFRQFEFCPTCLDHVRL